MWESKSSRHDVGLDVSKRLVTLEWAQRGNRAGTKSQSDCSIFFWILPLKQNRVKIDA
jgi:hypothetical protein